MNRFNTPLKNLNLFGINKADTKQVQVLLKTVFLLKLSLIIINHSYQISAGKRSNTVVQLLVKSTYLSIQLSHITVTFIYLVNKSKAYFLIPKNLAIAHSSSY